MKNKRKFFYSLESKQFFTHDGKECQQPNPLAQVIILLPTTPLFIAHVSDSDDEDQLYTKAFKQ